jgi:hypothetical protein
LTHSYCYDMFRQLIACHPQGALVVLAKITIKHEHSSIVMGVAAYHGLVCTVYSVRVSCAGRYVDSLHRKHTLNTQHTPIHDMLPHQLQCFIVILARTISAR